MRKSDSIVEYIGKKEKVFTRELVREFGVSVPTVHRAFDKMERKNEIKRIHGGAISLINKQESLFDKKLKIKRAQKKSICAYVAENFITEGDIIGIDTGTTAYDIVDYIKVGNLSIISNGLNTASHAAQKLPHANIMCTGGMIRSQLSACVGIDCINFLRDKKITTLILTCSGIELKSNAMYEEDSLLADVKRTMISIARRTILLVTSNKINMPSVAYFAKLSSMDDIVCDSEVDPAMLTALGSKPKVHIAPPL